MKDFLEELSKLGAVEVEPDTSSQDPFLAGLQDLGAVAVSDEEMLAIEDQKKYDDPLSAGVAGAARGLTFGLSDVAGRGLGYGEDLKKLQEYNPTSSTVGEVVGGVGGAFLGPGAALTKGALKATEVLAGSKLLAKPLGNAIAKSAAANAIEGAGYGVGQTISDQALGTPQSVAESLISNVGLGALIGGGLGAAGTAASEGTKKLAKQTSKFLKGEDKLGQWMGKVAGFVDDEANVIKPNIGEVSQAADELGVVLSPGMKSGSPIFQGLESSLEQSPTMFGNLTRGNVEPARKQIRKKAAELLDEASEKTAGQVGEEVKQALFSRVHELYDPVRVLYDEIGEVTKNITLSENAKKSMARSVERFVVENTARGSTARQFGKSVIEDLSDEGFKSLDQLKNTISLIGDKASAAKRAGEANEARLLFELKSKLTNFQDRQIRRAAYESAASKPEGAEISNQLISEMKSAKKGWKEFKGFLEAVGVEGGLGKISSMDQFLDKIETISPERLTQKLFDKKNSKSLKFFQEQFPEQFDAVRRVELAKIRNAVKMEHPVYGEIVNPKKLLAETSDKKMSKEVQTILFGEQGVRTLKNMEKIVGAFPNKIGASGTPEGLDFQNMFSIQTWFRDAFRWGAYTGGTIVRDVEEAQGKVIADKIKLFVDPLAKSSISGSTIGATSVASNYQERMDEIERIAGDPNLYVQKMMENTKGIGESDPDLQIAINNTAMEAVQFLNRKAPKDPFVTEMFPSKFKWRPSDQELSIYNRYVQALDDPYSILDDMNANLLTPEAVEAVRTIYPDIYSKITRAYIEQIGALEDDVPFTKKTQLSMLLGQPTTSVQDASFIQKLQQSNKQMQQSQAPTGNHSARQNDGVDLAKNTMSQSEKLIASRG